MTHFKDLGLAKPLLTALAEEGYTTPTPIQALAIPTVLEGRDLLGIAQTGTGKTAAFALPILQRLAADKRPAPRRGCRVLVLSPTRELASQIAESFRVYGRHLGLSVAVVFGGVKYGPQVRALAAGVDVLVATPGRLIDHINEKVASLAGVEVFVLDEADQMLDLGFLPPIRRIVATLPKQRQNLFFSATMPTGDRQAGGGAAGQPRPGVGRPGGHDRDPRRPADPVRGERPQAPAAGRTVRRLEDGSGLDLHANQARRGQGGQVPRAGPASRPTSSTATSPRAARAAPLAAFKVGATVQALVATDIAARGIDVDAISHVVNFDPPQRAGVLRPPHRPHGPGRHAELAGIAVSLVADDERGLLEGHPEGHPPDDPKRSHRVAGEHPGAGRARAKWTGSRSSRSVL